MSTFVEIISSMSERMLQTMASLPQIQSVEDIIKNMTPDMRQKMSFALGPAFQEGMAELTTQELEAIRRLREAHLKMAIFYQQFTLASEMAVVNLDTALSTVHKLQRKAIKWGEKLDGPWADFALLLQAQAARKYLFEFMKDQGFADPEAAEAMKYLMPNIPGHLANEPRQQHGGQEGDEDHDDFVIVEDLGDLDLPDYPPDQGMNGRRAKSVGEAEGHAADLG